MLIAKFHWDLEASIVDVETPFLHSDPQEEIYMSIPECMRYNSKHCIVITKTIYELVRSARDELLVELKKSRFNLNVEGTFQDYLSCLID
jgi:hypothetical protein